MIDKIEKSKCTGCKMCADVCGQNVIKFEDDEHGFWYPQVDASKCTECGVCINTCPAINVFKSNCYHEPLVYAAWTNDLQMRLQSTSGGIFYALAKKILEDDGIVVACRFTENWKAAEHTIVRCKEELPPVMGSKYFQSDTAEIYGKVKHILEEGKRVLFCGAPCQSAALQKFLQKKYENLITMDFICRGINSPKAYRAFIEELEERYQSKIKSVQFKNKRQGWTSLATLIEFENGLEHYETKYHSDWVRAYIKHNLYMRPSCHECQYRTIPRISDFTVGDFWGITNITEEDKFNGISVVFTNSDAAEALWEQMKEELHMEKHMLKEALDGNGCLLDSPAKGIHSEEFFELLKTKTFTEAVTESCGKPE